MGDYFLPGTPFEGWELQIGSQRVQAFNTDTLGYLGTLVGSGSSSTYSSSVGSVSNTWTNTFDSVTVIQTTTIDSGALYFTIQVTLVNLSHSPVDNIYYFRSLDPDNDETWAGGSFVTSNKIVSQGPDSTVVTATGLTGPITMMALGTTDSNARSLIYPDWPIADSVDLSTIYNETYSPAAYAVDSVNVQDFAIGLVTKVPHLATVDSMTDSVYRTTSATYTRHPANSTTFTFFYAFGQNGLDSALTNLEYRRSSLKIKNINNSIVAVYPNPAKDLVNITGLSSGDQVTLFDMMGRAVLNKTIGSPGINTIPLNNMAPGAYILVAKDMDGNMKSRVPVQKL